MKRSLFTTEAIDCCEFQQPPVDSKDHEARVRDRDPIWALPRLGSAIASIAARDLHHVGFAAEMPATSALGDDKLMSRFCFCIGSQDVVIEHLHQRFIFRRGKPFGCVTNTDFIGVGASLDTGTVSPQVNRQTREIRP